MNWRQVIEWSVYMFVATWYRTTYRRSIPDSVSEAHMQGLLVKKAQEKEPK